MYRPACSRDEFRAGIAGTIVNDLVVDFGDLALIQFVDALEHADPLVSSACACSSLLPSRQMAVRRPFASLLAVAGLGMVLAAALLLVAFPPPPLGDALRRCSESGNLCSICCASGIKLARRSSSLCSRGRCAVGWDTASASGG